MAERALRAARPLDSLVLEIDRRAPFRVVAGLAAHDREIFLLESAGELAWLAVADGLPVDREDRLDLVAGAAEERLLGGVELGAVDLALIGLAAEILLEDPHHRGARDALEDVARDARRHRHTVPHHEKARARRFRDAALLRQDDRVVVVVGAGLEGREPAV